MINNKEKGLTIIELLVTITILVATATTVLVLGDRAVSQSGLFTAYAKATFLAKEGMEILSDSDIRNTIEVEVDDEEWLVNYKARESDGAFAWKEGCTKPLKIDENGFYSHEGTEESSFFRCVRLWQKENKLKVEVKVSFDYKGNDYNVILHRIFYD